MNYSVVIDSTESPIAELQHPKMEGVMAVAVAVAVSATVPQPLPRPVRSTEYRGHATDY